ncbi:MAG TPA: MMPL family transporter [Solirubrobacteraceae bacterium]|nr:MMPL family transporter [Solirubrobacteraceae bacterium]
MHRLLTVGARRPRAALAAWVLATAILGVVGLGVGQHLAVSNLLVPGTESAHEAHLFQQQFGNGISAPILLTGPTASLNQEGPALAQSLARLPGAHVVSAWDGGSMGRSLRPSPGAALVLVAVIGSGHTASTDIERSIRGVVHTHVAAPVHARISGLDAVGLQLESASFSAVHRAELIAIPLLLVVLLLVFGSPAAAAIPAVLGFGTVFAGFGLISLLASVLPLTELATIAASMMGLALGVDYSLLVVSRFRDELRDAGDPREIRRAAAVAALRAGRTVAFAGGAIAVLMLCALAVAAGTLLLSAVVGVIIVAAVSVASTILAAPAALALWGRHVVKGAATRPATASARPAAASARPAASGASRSLIARAGRSSLIVGAAAAGLLALGWQALSLATGPPDARQLPAASSARRDYEAVSKRVGPGWLTPYELLVVVHSGAITTLPRLDAIAAAQRTIAGDPDVAGVIGPGPLAAQARPLAHAETTVADTNRSLKRSARDVVTLSTRLGQAAAGAGRVKAGFAQAADAVHTLASGGADGGGAVVKLRAGLEQAAAGSRLTDAGLLQAAQGAIRVASGGRSAATGATRLASQLGIGSATAASAGPRLHSFAQKLHADATSLGTLADSVGALGTGPANANAQLATASQELAAMQVGRGDPRYDAVVQAVQAAQSSLASTPAAGDLADQLRQLGVNEQQAGSEADSLATSVAQLTQSANRLRLGAQRLSAGLATLERGQSALATGVKRLASSGAALTAGLVTLSTGTATLGHRLGSLQSGAGGLARGLAHEQRQAALLTSALSAGQRSAAATAKASPGHSQLLGTLARNPGVFRSGYMVLAGLEGSAAAQHAGVDFTVNVARTGEAARMVIVPRSAPASAATGALRHRLEKVARALAAATGARVLVGGPAAQLRDYSTVAAGRMPLLIAVLMLATFVLLVLVFRSLFAALVGVLLNLLSVGAAFGALSLLSGGSHPLIGGPGHVDALSVSAMFAATFALSIDYQVFLLTRIREGWLRTGSVAEGVDYGIARTARVVAGAAAVMVGVFLAFATSDVATVRQLGIGLAVAISLDATVVRLILLPHALRLGGRFTWWLPSWLDRRLPVLDVGVDRRRRERPHEIAVAPPAPSPRPEPAPASPRRTRAPRERTRPAAGTPVLQVHRAGRVLELPPVVAASPAVATAAVMPLHRES